MKHLPLYIALKYLRRKKGSKFFSVIGIISICGVFVGVTALIIVLSVMNGMQSDLKRRIIGANPHILVFKFMKLPIPDYDSTLEKIKSIDEIKYVAPIIVTEAIASHSSAVSGVYLRGVNINEEKNITRLKQNVVLGEFSLSKGINTGYDGVLIGKELANILGVSPGNTISVSSPEKMKFTPMGVFPQLKKLEVKGIFDTGMYDYNKSLLYVSLETAQNFMDYSENTVNGFEIHLDDIYAANRISEKIDDELLYPFYSISWMNMNKNLFAALRLEKIAMFLILTLIIIVAAFNIISTLIVLVNEKKKDIGILKSMGMSTKEILHLFISVGGIIGFIGTSLGLGAGYLGSYLLGKYRFIDLPGDVYIIDKLPVQMLFSDFITVALAAVAISLAASIYPAYRAANLEPVKAIRELT